MDNTGVKFLEDVINVLKEEQVYGDNRNVPVVEFKHPDQLRDEFDFTLKNTKGCSDEKLRKLCKAVARFSVKTNHRHFHNQLYGGVDMYGLAGTWISEALNTSQYTFEVAPVFTLAEHVVITRALELFGLSTSDGGGDGILAPGGSSSNMYAMVAARYQRFPQVKSQGARCLPKLVLFTSEQGHYSINKGAHWLGIGTENVRAVPTNEHGQMLATELDRLLQESTDQGECPIFVNATAGTTVLGSFDPFNEIADVCVKHGVWMHVDACWGGSLILSEKYKGVLNGTERADSIAWNPHKMLGAPLQCCLTLVRHRGLLHRANAAAADYLFQQDKFYDVSFDTGDKSVQCGRKVDAFKLWLMWKARGSEGFSSLVDNAMDKAMYLRQLVSSRPGYKMVTARMECTNVCFWYIPERMRGQKMDEAWWDDIHKITAKMKELMVLSGTLMVGYTPLQHHKNFFRVVITCHPPATEQDMDYIAEQIQYFGEKV